MNTARAAQPSASLGTLPVFALSSAWLTWHAWADVWVGDSGEVGAAAHVLGVAHPTGFPLDMLLLRLAGFLPLGPIAFRQNVAVALISSLALAQLAQLACLLCERANVGDELQRRVGAAFGVCVLLTSTTFLDSALAVEVYSTSLLLLLSAAVAALRGGSRRGVVWALLGLACSAHVTAGLLMLPLLAASIIAFSDDADHRDRLRMLCVRACTVLPCALLVTYLPLASLRDPAMDWGDPQTLTALFEHLSASRVRAAFAHEMFAASGHPGFVLASQLGEHAAWLAPAALGLVCLFVRARRLALVLVSVLAADLGYAVWINPMGIEMRQLGHASGAVLAAVCAFGVTTLCAWLGRWSALRVPALAGACIAALVLCMRTSWPSAADGHVVAERYGSCSPLLALPPRSVYLCSTDVACAAALFAVYAEGVRPDLSVAPAQHLWDATVLRRIDDVAALERYSRSQPTAATARRDRAVAAVQALLVQPQSRPVFFESNAPVREAIRNAAVRIGEPAPYVRAADTIAGQVAPSVLAQVDAYVLARCGTRAVSSELCRDAWFNAYETLGQSALMNAALDAALTAFQRGVELAPKRAVGFTNLAVVLEARGSALEAIDALRRAIELDASRPAPWVNLTRLMIRTGDAADARRVIAAARASGVDDARLDALDAKLAAHGSTGN